MARIVGYHISTLNTPIYIFIENSMQSSENTYDNIKKKKLHYN